MSFWFRQYFPKKRTKQFDFTTMKPQMDLCLFIFWRKLKAPKRHLKIIWHLVGSKTVWNLKIWKGLGSKVLLWSPLRRLLVRRGTTHERVFWNKRGRGRRALFIRKPAGTYCWLDSIKNPNFRSYVIKFRFSEKATKMCAIVLMVLKFTW